jgi:PmbA protein
VLTVEAGTGGELLGVGRSETRGVGIRVVAAGRTGYASTSRLTADGLAGCLRLAVDSARVGEPDPSVALPRPLPAPAAPAPDSPSTPVGDAVALARHLARRATGLDPRVSAVHAATFREERSSVVVASTTGVRAAHAHGCTALSVDVLGEDGGTTAAESASRTVREPGGLDVDAITADAVARATRLLGPRRPLPRGVPLLLDPEVAAVLIAAAGRALTGAPDRSGPLGGPGDPVAAAHVSLTDDGLDPRFPASAPVDDEGVPRGRTPLIRDGSVVGALRSTGTATRSGARSTGNARRGSHKSPPGVAPTTLVLHPTATDLWRFAPDLLYVQQLAVGHAPVDPVTGRIGGSAVGFLVRGGEPAGPVERWLLETTLREVLRAVEAVGDDAVLVPGQPVAAPTLACAPRLASGSPLP